MAVAENAGDPSKGLIPLKANRTWHVSSGGINESPGA